MGAKHKVRSLEDEVSDGMEEEEEYRASRLVPKSRKVAKEHKDQLQRLQEKDPEFYKFLQEHDKELLEFDDEDSDDNVDTDVEEAEVQVDDEIDGHDVEEEEEKPSRKVITTAMVDSWCNSIKENGQLGAVRSLLIAFRIACHYGDDAGDESAAKFSTYLY